MRYMGIIGVILGLHWDDGQEHGNYYELKGSFRFGVLDPKPNQ